MNKRLALAGGAALVVAAVVVARVPPGTAQGPQAVTEVDTSALRGPRQPIFYRHDVHAGQYEMDCRYCHFAAETSSSAGLPTLATCMGCHRVVGTDLPEVQKLQQAAFAEEDEDRLAWVEVHVLAPFVRFPHQRHVNSNTGELADKTVTEKCETCHGPIRQMPQVYRFASLKMGWCVDCHRKSEVTTDCTVCHY